MATRLRVVMLALLILGIVGMHTLGHPAAGHGSMPAMATVGAPADHPEHAGPAVVGLGMGLDPMSVCLAVLTALTLLLVAAAASRFARGSQAVRVRVDPGRAGSSRGPPRPLLADLSVLRI
ncbi:hypothetical protein Lfu02_59890 [Longispora fulva]|uniref:Uncharacterized protein n=1 Tax=Longispora fulva TaxID=619741 RepID=A0A8J7KJM2_9ACTN|nr:DUF6153 family protein [Longispora fulva]MBG6137029.1 hypothetical protein [Longispora fulva]GIG61617.1 hypothetical protein Lfu02_59890 [Longispora fulva]